MIFRNLSQTFWIAVSAIAGAIVAGVTVFQLISPSPVALHALVTDSSALTGRIESFPYRHAASQIYENSEDWREQWSRRLADKLKARRFKPDQLKIVDDVMEEIIRERNELRFMFPQLSVTDTNRWYSVTLRNNGDVPLKRVFLKFPAAKYWIDGRGRLAPTLKRIEIGDMDQKSEKNFTLWGKRFGSSSDNENIVLGHSNGIGDVEFE